MLIEKDDVEAGRSLLYSLMQERPELGWAFNKVYIILILQLLASIGFAALVVFVNPIASFFASTRIGLVVYVVSILIPITVVCLLYYYREKHLLNLFLLGIFILWVGFALGVACAFTSGK